MKNTKKQIPNFQIDIILKSKEIKDGKDEDSIIQIELYFDKTRTYSVWNKTNNYSIDEIIKVHNRYHSRLLILKYLNHRMIKISEKEAIIVRNEDDELIAVFTLKS